MTQTPKRRIGPGIGAVLFGFAGLAACGGEVPAAVRTEPDGALQAGASDEGRPEPDGGVVALDPALLLPVDERAVLISSHVTVAAALARAGQNSDAVQHLRLAISEIKPGGLTRLVENGFDPDLIDTTAAALDSGAAPEDVEAQLVAIESNVAALREKAGGDPVPLIRLLVEHCQNAYRAGVSLDNQVADPIEYQDAYGYAITAQELAGTLDSGDAGGLQLELKMLALMWPAIGPVSGDLPAPPMTFLAQVSRVESELSTLQ